MTVSFKSMASWAVLVLILMQFVPLRRINPPADSEIQLPESIKHSLKKACYDCHSYETRWRGIAYIAPASWLASSSVSSGRMALNFSTWNDCNRREKRLTTTKLGDVVSAGAAHQPLYYLWQPEAQLTASETRALLKWLTDF